YQPRHSQPFTLAEAVGLDVPIITDEIARLHNSLQHLKETQQELRQLIQEPEKDPVLLEAFQDNETVITYGYLGISGSQEERISILNMALVEKGVIASSGHY
ncbi:hypothetical protein BV25DRAFT_1786088, partial [Artomyces pyxidatus]